MKNPFLVMMLLSLFQVACIKDKEIEKKAGEIADENSGKKNIQMLSDTIAYAFPGAEGWGKNATGGRGGQVIKVTNLNDSGPGSLRDAINQNGKRIVVFEVSGDIILQSPLTIKKKDITIAGQTAPGGGICIQGYNFKISANNVIIRYMRFRLGDTNSNGVNEFDAFGGGSTENVIIDHCSMSWSIDEVASFYHNKNFTMQWCIISESMNNSGHPKGAHGYGGIWGGSPASFHHNLIAHHRSRNPRFEGGKRYSNGGGSISAFGIDKVDFRNNVIYNWSGNSVYGGENGEYNMVNNYYKPGPATPTSSVNRRIVRVTKDDYAGAPDTSIYAPGYGKFYITGNYVNGNSTVTTDNWNGGVSYDPGVTKAMVQRTTPIAFEPISVHTAVQAYNAVLLYAGASYKRDTIDARISQEVQNGTATYIGSQSGLQGIIDSQNDVGGWPFLNSLAAPIDTDNDGMPDNWEIANGLNHTVANANGHDLSTVYDNIEVYINSLVVAITQNQNQ